MTVLYFGRLCSCALIGWCFCNYTEFYYTLLHFNQNLTPHKMDSERREFHKRKYNNILRVRRNI